VTQYCTPSQQIANAQNASVPLTSAPACQLGHLNRSSKAQLPARNAVIGQRIDLRRFGLFTAMTLVLILACMPEYANAHVKWFTQYNLLCPPRAPFAVLLSTYFIGFSAFVAPLMFGVSYADRHIEQSGILWSGRWSHITQRIGEVADVIGKYTPVIIRLAVSVFFFTVFLWGEFILTPELKTDAVWVRWVQLAIALLALSPRTAWLGALGVAVLYGKAIEQYGLFHLLDYPIFLGVAAYVFLWSVFRNRTALLADAVLRSFTAVTLLWGGIEKFAYPEWSFTLLTERPELTFGLNPEFYMVAAGFVEFCAAYLLISGKLASRAAAVVLLFFFVSAIVPFGAIDAVGHSVIIVVLLVLAFGRSNIVSPHLDLRSPRATAIAHVSVFFAVLILLMGAYYGGHYASFRF
jgi:hypothetical protein